MTNWDQLPLFDQPIDRVHVSLTRGEYRGEVDVSVTSGRLVAGQPTRKWESESYRRLTVDEASDVVSVWLSVLAWAEG